ncbi:MAG: hypothetical protein NC324_09400 [Bacteroides sp.]|nr:hypothetical protein [Bacteroides sp.]
MKKLAFFLSTLLFSISVFAQTPNRMLVQDATGYKGYVLDRVDSITFAEVSGEVKADVTVLAAVCDTLTLSVTRSENCRGFKINVVPATIAGQLTNDLAVINWLNRLNSPTYYEDFTNGKLTGINLDAGSDYVVYTVGIDEYGVEAGVCKAEFSTPEPEIVGDPKVEVKIIDTKTRSFKIEVTPNDDVKEYYCLSGEKGTMQSQYEMFGPMFGFTNFGQMIKAWGQIPRSGKDSVEWTSMEPNTEFEIFIVCTDVNDALAPYQVFEVSTLELGGPGAASVSIELKEYKLADWEGEELPSQFITFTPNDQTSCFRFNVVKDDTSYNNHKEEYWSELRSDPPMPMAYWFFYEEITTDFQIDPNTAAVAIAAAKNSKGEWGEVTELKFTTPDRAIAAKSMASKIVSRLKAVKGQTKPGNGFVPRLNHKVGMTLAH